MDSSNGSNAPSEPQPLTRPAPARGERAWLNGIYAGICLYLFVSAINIMSAGLKTLGQQTDWLRNLLANADNPFIALMGSVIVTAVVQSSSFTTSLIITLVAAGQLKLETAVYCVMGANIGTSVTAIIAALGSMHIRWQFRRAFTAALVHDIFNWLTVLLLFPLEWITSALAGDEHGGWLTRLAAWITAWLGLDPVPSPYSPIKVVTEPMVRLFNWIGKLAAGGTTLEGALVAVLGLTLLLTALVLMVKNLKGALLRRVEALFSTVFFRNDLTSYVVGVISTILVQSSSITTTLVVPLAAAGAVQVRRVFAFMLGANLGTTVTGVIAATANPVAAAVTVALAHVLFNGIGTLVWYPLKKVPLAISEWYGDLAARSRLYAFLFLGLVFIVIPGLGILITELLTGKG